MPKKELKETPVPELDLRKISRYSDKVSTLVELHWDWNSANNVRWIRCGAVHFRRSEDRTRPFVDFGARLQVGVTDFEHDSGYAFQFRLAGCEFRFMDSGRSWFDGFIDASDTDEIGAEDFRVPQESNYNPMKHPNAYKCTECKGVDKGHIIVPEGLYLPPKNIDLYRKVRGKRVTIITGPNLKNDD